jgi:hypothetical protein
MHTYAMQHFITPFFPLKGNHIFTASSIAHA